MPSSPLKSLLHLGLTRSVVHVAERGAALALPGIRTASFIVDTCWNKINGNMDSWKVPATEPSVSLAAKVAVDETFRALLVAMKPPPSHEEFRRIRAEFDTATSLYETKGWADEPALYHRTPPRLDRVQLSRQRVFGYPYDHLQFPSEYEPRPEEPGRERWLSRHANRRAHAWLLRHNDGPRPWLVCLHGYRMGIPTFDLVAFRARWLHERLGLNVLIPVLPLHGPRKANHRSGEGYISADSLDTVFAVSQAIWDIRRLLTWVRAQQPLATGVYGVSLGAYHASLLSGLDAGLACVIAGIPASNFAELAREHVTPFLRSTLDGMGLRWSEVHKLFRVISPLAVTPRVAHGGRFIFAGLADRLVPRSQVHQLWHHWERPRVHWYQGGHVSYNWEPSVKRFVEGALESSGLLVSPRVRSIAA
ncbi:MAG: alpha/beta hydrolase [Candidatus Binatia bacterium]